MDRRISIGFVFLSLILMFYSCGLNISNPGKSRYTNHGGLSMNKGSAQRGKAQLSEEKVTEPMDEAKVEKSIKKATQSDEEFWLIALWAFLVLGSIAWLFFSIYLNWAIWLIVMAGVFLGVVLFASVILIMLIIIFS